MIDYKAIALFLHEAERKKQPVTCITNQFPDFSVEMGYKVQQHLVNQKLQEGSKIFAYKMGLTSPAKMKQMKITESIYGFVFDNMVIENNGKVNMEDFIHPKVEAEIAFILSEDIEGPNITGEEVLEKTKWIVPALEIIDSRYENFRFTLPDVIADNTSASRVIMGKTYYRPQDYDVKAIEVSMSLNGDMCANGISSEVLGNPANSVAMLANMFYNHGKRKIKKGSIIFTGGITEAIFFQKGDNIGATYKGMDKITFSVG